jgi:hypothetical protein
MVVRLRAAAAVAVLFVAGCGGGSSSSVAVPPPPGWTLYDPLTATTLDGALWQTPRLTRSISGGAATLSVAANHMQARSTQGVSYNNAISVLPGSNNRVTSLQADVKVPSGGATRGGTATATAAGGIRLNYQPAANRNASSPGINGNFLSVRVELYDGGSGLRIRRNVSHCDDAVCSTYSMTGVATIDPVGFATSGTSAYADAQYDTTYRVGLSLDEGTKTFTWTIDGGAYSGVSGTIDVSTWATGVGMDPIGSSTNGFASAQLIARAFDEAGGGDGAITAEFGNVWVGLNGIGASLYDDFASMGSSVTVGFSPNLWSPTNGDVTAPGGDLHLHSAVTSSGATVVRNTPVNPMVPASFSAWRADLAIVSDTRAGSGVNDIEMGGAFVNDGSGGGTYDATGDLRANVSLRTNGASYSVTKCLNATCGANTGVVGFTPIPTSATHPLGLGTVHTVTEGWDAASQTFTFQIDDAAPATTAPLNISAPRAPFVPLKLFQTQVTVPPGTPGAQVEGTVKNVWVYR